MRRRPRRLIKRFSEEDHKLISSCRDIFIKPKYSGGFIPVSSLAAELTLIGGWWTNNPNREITSVGLESLLLERFSIVLEVRPRGERGYFKDVFQVTFNMYSWNAPNKGVSSKIPHVDFWHIYHRIADYVFTAKFSCAPYYTQAECMEHVRLQTVLREILDEILDPMIVSREEEIDTYVRNNPHTVLKFERPKVKNTQNTGDERFEGPYGA